MCGIAGLLRLESAELDSALIEPMTELVEHRGPDGRGTEVFGLTAAGLERLPPGERARWRVALGHRRLSIIDLSEAGHQPMRYGVGERGDLWLTYNGEIYNYLELREELVKLGYSFRSTSDTEVILAAYAAWGSDCFARLRGMFGILLVDGARRRAVIARDRLGIKPLYYVRGRGVVAVASEVKQFSALPIVDLVPRGDALLEYLATGYEDTSRTFYRDVESLAPGTWREIRLDDLSIGDAVPYWFPERVKVEVTDPEEAGRRFAAVLREAVRIHLRSDVPVGCALSGGLDSSSIAVLVAERGRAEGAPLHTFTATFPGHAIDERSYVDAVIRKIAATPHFVTPEPEALVAELDRFLWIHDEPVGSASQYAAWCIARITREAGVPVTLNGQGGDEVLAGYWQSYFMHLQGLARGRHPLALAQHFVGALAGLGPGDGNPELARQVPIMVRRFLERRAASTSAKDKLTGIFGMSEAERRVYEIRQLHLPRLLKWDDRNFMAFAVEGRYPFLDHVLIETTLSFAPSTLYARGWTKEPLRRGLAGVLPEEIARRKTKFGFETPQVDWLSGPLRRAIDPWLTGQDAPLWSWVEPSHVRKLADAARAGGTGAEEAAQALFRHFLADRWLTVIRRGAR